MPSLRSLYHSNLDKYYVRMLKKLERDRILVTELEHRLEVTRESCNYLEEMLEPYLITPPKASSSAISRCPPEVLVEIFTWALHDDHHPLIRRLLLVCKKWYNTIMHSPRLWSRMHLILDSTRIHSPLSLVPYVEACMERSGRLALDVYISCENLLHETQTVEQLVADFLNQLHSNFTTQPHTDQSSAYLRIESNLIERRDVEENEVIEAVLGDEGANMCRWRSLRFVGNGATSSFNFDGVTPALEYLEIEGVQRAGDEWLWNDFPDLSSLRTFKTCLCRQFAPAFARCTALTSLHLETTNQDFDGTIISLLSSLEKLHVHIEDEDGRKIRAHNAIHLPALRSLTLLGGIKNLMLARFTLPLLSTVVLGPTAGFHTYPRGFPTLLELNFTKMRYSTATVVKSISPLHEVEEVCIRGSDLWTIEEAIKQLVESGRWPSTLQTVQWVAADGARTTVELPPYVECSAIRASTPANDSSSDESWHLDLQSFLWP